MWTVTSLFSGIGGIDYAFESAGFEITTQVEIDPFCQRVLRKHWPDAQLFGDVYAVRAEQLQPTHVLTAGFNCQPFSLAGAGRGEWDPRFIWPEVSRLVAGLAPMVVFLENVPGLRTNSGGRVFKRILGELAEMGYDAQ
jgi:DNA (cytosine-5)-methyltransferase 1